MALLIRNNKIIVVFPPKKLTNNERKRLIKTPIAIKLIKKATSRKYNIL